MRTALAQLAALAPDAATEARVRSVAEVLNRECDRELVGLRPHRLLLAALEKIGIAACLSEISGAPRIVVQGAERAALGLLGPLGDLTRDARVDVLTCLETEPTTRAVVEGVSLRYLDHWTAERPLVHALEVDLSRPWLARLAVEPALWAQQVEVLRTSGGWGSIAGAIEGVYAFPPELAPLSPAALLALHDGMRDGSIAGRWIGARETPFLLGRLAHLLGPPPATDGPAFALEVVVDGVVGTARAHDAEGDGMPGLTVDRLSAAQAERVVAALFASTQCADVVGDGFHDGCGVYFRLGVRGGRLFAEGDARVGAPPWHVAR